MTQEDKQELLTYICMALPYGLMGDRLGITHKIISVNISDRTVTLSNGDYIPNTYYLDAAVLPVKPYLRPLSSMTDEEYREWHYLYLPTPHENEAIETKRRIDWLLKNHFDFMGLIPKGLAIAITEQNNPYKT